VAADLIDSVAPRLTGLIVHAVSVVPAVDDASIRIKLPQSVGVRVAAPHEGTQLALGLIVRTAALEISLASCCAGLVCLLTAKMAMHCCDWSARYLVHGVVCAVSCAHSQPLPVSSLPATILLCTGYSSFCIYTSVL
jgi:hypothetical protein